MNTGLLIVRLADGLIVQIFGVPVQPASVPASIENSIVSRPALAFASATAWLRLPGPLPSVFVTHNADTLQADALEASTASQAAERAAARRGAERSMTTADWIMTTSRRWFAFGCPGYADRGTDAGAAAVDVPQSCIRT